MKHIGNLQATEGSTKKKKRIGRGPGSGFGRTSTKGNKGHQSRSGFSQNRGFEGGQMPLNRRVPKFGFYNRFRTEYQIVNVGRLQELIDIEIITDNKITPEILLKVGAVSKSRLPVKILGNGDLVASLVVEANSFSATAKEKIEAAGGTVIIHG